jgi:hypothetical protein
MKTLNTLRELDDNNPENQSIIKDASSLTLPALANLTRKKGKKATNMSKMSPKNKGTVRNKGGKGSEVENKRARIRMH